MPALIAHLELTDYDLSGYALGATVVAGALTLGARVPLTPSLSI